MVEEICKSDIGFALGLATPQPNYDGFYVTIVHGQQVDLTYSNI